MEIHFNELKINIKPTSDGKFPDLLAHVSLTLLDEHKRHLAITGFTLRKSKFNIKPYLCLPSKSLRQGGFFKFVLIDNSLLKEIQKEVIKQYEYNNIPVVEESEDTNSTAVSFN